MQNPEKTQNTSTYQHQKKSTPPDIIRQTGSEPGDNIRILCRVVLLVATVDMDRAVLLEVDLGPLAVILVLTGELGALEPREHLRHA